MPVVDPYVVDIMGALFPGRRFTLDRLVERPSAAHLQWWVLPSVARPRLLVPVGCRAAAVMLTRHGGGARNVARRLVAVLVRSGSPRLPLHRLRADGVGDDSPSADIGGVLEQLLGEPVVLGVLLGPPRANRKPVLQVFGADGRPVAFVKVGHDDRTRQLVEREATCLSRVNAAGLRLVQPPEVTYAGRRDGLSLLVLAPLSSSQQKGRGVEVAPPLDAMAEVAASSGVTRERLSSSSFWSASRDATASIVDRGLRLRVDEVMRGIEGRYADETVVMGSWHGDWAPWNMGTVAGRVQLWDWERYSDDVPWGFDVVHFLSQRVKHGSSVVGKQEQSLLNDLPGALRRTGDHGPEQHVDVVLLTYLLTVCLRFASESGGSEPGRPSSRALWAVGLAERVLGRAAVPQ